MQKCWVTKCPEASTSCCWVQILCVLWPVLHVSMLHSALQALVSELATPVKWLTRLTRTRCTESHHCWMTGSFECNINTVSLKVFMSHLCFGAIKAGLCGVTCVGLQPMTHSAQLWNELRCRVTYRLVKHCWFLMYPVGRTSKLAV